MAQPQGVTEGRAQSSTSRDTNGHIWGHNRVLWHNPGVLPRTKPKPAHSGTQIGVTAQPLTLVDSVAIADP